MPRSPQPNVADDAPPFTLRFWVVVIAVGVGVGLVGAGLMGLLHVVERLAWGSSDDLLAAVEHNAPWRRVGNLVVAGLWVGLVGLLLRRLFARAGGDVEAAIWFNGGRVAPLATVARGVASIVAVGLGISLGREAAVKQAGGAVASWCARWLGPTDAEAARPFLVAAGVGAGMAAAYNVPLGGALFALEVLLGTVSLRLVLPAVAMSVVATATSWITLPHRPIYLTTAPTLTPAATVWALLAGPLFGLVAVAVIRTTTRAAGVRPQGVWAVAAPVAVLALLGVASISLPHLLGNGQDAVQVALNGQLPLRLLLLLPALKLVATGACLAVGGRGGLFTPTMMIGATAGALLGHAWGFAWPGGVDPGLAAMIGAAAVLAAASHAPVSAIVLVMELTRHGDATMVPILLATLGATLTAGHLDHRSIYSARAMPGT